VLDLANKFSENEIRNRNNSVTTKKVPNFGNSKYHNPMITKIPSEINTTTQKKLC